MRYTWPGYKTLHGISADVFKKNIPINSKIRLGQLKLLCQRQNKENSENKPISRFGAHCGPEFDGRGTPLHQQNLVFQNI